MYKCVWLQVKCGLVKMLDWLHSGVSFVGAAFPCVVNKQLPWHFVAAYPGFYLQFSVHPYFLEQCNFDFKFPVMDVSARLMLCIGIRKRLSYWCTCYTVVAWASGQARSPSSRRHRPARKWISYHASGRVEKQVPRRDGTCRFWAETSYSWAAAVAPHRCSGITSPWWLQRQKAARARSSGPEKQAWEDAGPVY